MDRSEAVQRESENNCIRKARQRGDLTFTLVGQDLLTPTVICEWIKQNIETAPPDKLRDALEQALEARRCGGRKRAD